MLSVGVAARKSAQTERQILGAVVVVQTEYAGAMAQVVLAARAL